MSTPGVVEPRITELSFHDCLRALCCAEAVHQQSNELVEKFLKEMRDEVPLVAFGDVHVSLDLPEVRPKFLVAQSYDAIFVAFQGSTVFDDVVGDVEVSPSLHGRMSKLADDFVANDWLMLLDLLKSNKRTIVCGHRLGGTLAHLVVLRFWKNLMSVLEVATHYHSKKSMISVAFGAPYMFHEMYDVEMDNRKSSNPLYDKLHHGIKSHFFDFAHWEDPALDLILRPDYADPHNADQGSRDLSKGGQALHDEGGVTYPASDRSSGERTSMVDCQSQKYLLGPVNVGGGRSSPRTKKQPDFRRLSGNIYLLKGIEQTRSMLKPRSKQWTQQEFRRSYTSALNSEESLFDPTMGLDQSPEPLELNVTTPEPIINSVFRTNSDTQHYITITGKNLLFLRGPVKLDGIHSCEIKLQTDTRIIVIGPDPKDVSDSLITVSTAFGGATHHLKLEEMPSDGSSTAVRRLLRKIVQTYIILATPPLCYLERKDSELHKDLDSIVQCVPELGGMKFSTMFEKIALRDVSCEDRDENIQKTLVLADNVVEFLTRVYRIQFDDSFKCSDLMIRGGFLLLAVSGIALPAVGIYALAGGVNAGTAALAATIALGGGLSTTVAGAFLDKDGINIPDYPEVLKIAIEEASLWPGKGQTSSKSSINVNEDARTEADLETLLLSEVERCESYWTGMMKKHRDVTVLSTVLSRGIVPWSKSFPVMKDTFHGSRDIVLRSNVFKRVTPETKKNLLRRIEIVTTTLSAYKRELGSSKFVGIVGAEDAGKSTFIKKAIEQYGQKDDEHLQKDLPKVGLNTHTTVVRPYKLKDKLWLVDFPGGNGTEAYADAWRQFAALPSSCILLLDFKDKIKEPQRQMYENMKKDLVPYGEESKITVVFNKVDKKFTSNTEKVYDAAYFDKQREAAAKHLHCKIEDVYFTCLNPYPKEKLTKLRSYGVIGFEDLAQKVLGLGE